MNFREELRKKKYEIAENKETEVILQKILDYFQKRFILGDFHKVKIEFDYKIVHQTLAIRNVTKEISGDKETIFVGRVSGITVFYLLREKFEDEKYQIENSGGKFYVIIKP